MTEQDDSEHDAPPQQLKMMQRMVDLAIQRTTLAEKRTHLSAQRSEMSEHRSAMSEYRSELSAERSEMSAERSYLAAERTLSVWVRTALALMVFGLAIDRFGLMLGQATIGSSQISADMLSAVGGATLVAFGVLMAVTTGLRFLAYARNYRKTHKIPHRHGPFLAPLFALLVAIFGTALLFLLISMAL